MVGFLVNNGSAVDAKDKAGNNALMSAALGAHEQVVKLLAICGADIHAEDKDGQNSLCKVYYKNLERGRSGVFVNGKEMKMTARVLIDNGARMRRSQLIEMAANTINCS